MGSLSFTEELINARSILISGVKKELLGPGSEFDLPDAENELITDMPEVRYSVGILFPQDSQYKIDNDSSVKIEENTNFEEENVNIDSNESYEYDSNKKERIFTDVEDNTLDEEIALASQNLPSSMGFTCFVKGNIDTLKLKMKFGMYRRTKVDDCVVPFTPDIEGYCLPTQVQQYVEYSVDNNWLKLKLPLKKIDVFRIFDSGQIDDLYLRDRMFMLCNQFSSTGYKRIPFEESVTINFDEKEPYEENLESIPVNLVALRKHITNEITSVTVMMVNTNIGRYDGTNSIFQPEITISATDEDKYSFVEYNDLYQSTSKDEEERSLELLYRNKRVYGTGHGTSVSWEINTEGKGYIKNEFFPIEEIPQIDFEPEKNVDKCGLSMKYLSDLSSEEFEKKVIAMTTLIDSYSKWISDLEKACKDPNIVRVTLKDKADEHIEDSKISLQRMKKGIEILNNNANARIAFELANRAMFMQRVHLKLQEEDKYPNDSKIQKVLMEIDYYTQLDEYYWRPFQLAFLLMSIESIVDESCSDRDLVDLIWFPTGGGKTEAYLGLTAFTIFYRRLSTDNSDGTTVIMRYTLRLLAAQQFIRAATLICSCEAIRMKEKKTPKGNYPKYNLGDEPITIGLWIGGEHTPNKNRGRGKDDRSAQSYLKKLTDSNAGDLRYRKDKFNKFQVLKCPWCGTKLVKDNLSGERTEIGKWGYQMKNNKEFRLNCPQINCKFEKELPIQVVDEELYKNPPTLLFATVDKFAMLPWKREVGSFFATDSDNRAPELIIQDELHLISGPLGTMVGIYETVVDALCSAKGVKPKIIASTATIRRAKEQCSVLFNREVRQFPSPGIDANDSYFAKEADITKKNGRIYVGLMPSGKTKAMMEVRSIAAILGRTYMLNTNDKVKDKFWTLALYFNSLKDLGKCSTLINDDVKDFIKRTSYRLGLGRGRLIGASSELTSRVSTSDLNETLEKLERLEYSRENIDNKKYAVNTLLATNMISVGVDVARLNVMLLVGQPKLTSEYIQASSRIGRTFPGVAFTLYDGSKSRDRSHYEQFKGYHESFYRYVEPTGATPFSEPARERALHAVIISLMRHRYGLSQEEDASQFNIEHFKDKIDEIKRYIIERIESINLRSEYPINDETRMVESEIEQIFSEWHSKAEDNNLYYGEKFMVNQPRDDEKRLMKAFGSGGEDAAIETLTSMRNVDGSTAGNILIWED